ncbi:hypothetical protein B1218_38540, partial [Pseudomonas ogarae]
TLGQGDERLVAHLGQVDLGAVCKGRVGRRGEEEGGRGGEREGELGEGRAKVGRLGGGRSSEEEEMGEVGEQGAVEQERIGEARLQLQEGLDARGLETEQREVLLAQRGSLRERLDRVRQ